MSHIVSGKTDCKDERVIKKACKKLNLPDPVNGVHTVYNTTLHGVGVKLPGWAYPAVFNTDTGAVGYDTYNGSWGNEAELDKFKQRYSAETQRERAEAAGYGFEETTLADGSVKLEVLVEA